MENMTRLRSALLAIVALALIGGVAVWYFLYGPGESDPEPPSST